MLSLVTSGWVDVSFLPYLQWAQHYFVGLVKMTVLGTFAARRLIYDADLDNFIYASDVIGELPC